MRLPRGKSTFKLEEHVRSLEPQVRWKERATKESGPPQEHGSGGAKHIPVYLLVAKVEQLVGCFLRDGPMCLRSGLSAELWA